uniref:HMA domain-containing protein n=1 Tax=Leersia perrieri TaxID=77586 RepID=A0A0D9UZ32_9ORYZ
MSKKTVIKADLIGAKCKVGILQAVSNLQGVKSMDIDEENCTLTVLGPVDPVKIVHELKKKCFAAAVVSVEDDKPKEPAPPPAPEPEPEKCPCQCQNGCVCVKVCQPSCCHSPCVLPDCYFYKAYSYKPEPSYGVGYHIESGGHCTIQ